MFYLFTVRESENINSSCHSSMQLNELNINDMTSEFHPEAKKLVNEFKELPKQLPPKRDIEHTIDLIPNAPGTLNQPIYRMSEHELRELKSQLDDLLEYGFIKPSLSPYGSPVLFVRKKDGTMRLVVDYRKLNEITIKNSFGLPRADEQLESVRGARWFTKLDLHSGYNQLRVAEKDQWKTGFKCKFGHFEYNVTP